MASLGMTRPVRTRKRSVPMSSLITFASIPGSELRSGRGRGGGEGEPLQSDAGGMGTLGAPGHCVGTEPPPSMRGPHCVSWCLSVWEPHRMLLFRYLGNCGQACVYCVFDAPLVWGCGGGWGWGASNRSQNYHLQPPKVPTPLPPTPPHLDRKPGEADFGVIHHHHHPIPNQGHDFRFSK